MYARAPMSQLRKRVSAAAFWERYTFLRPLRAHCNRVACQVTPCLCVVMITLFTVSRVAAQPVPAAQALYERGVANFQAGRYELACQEFAESYRLEPLPGVLFTLATCEARAGRVASSAAHYADFLQLVSRLPPEQRALQRERVQVATAERNALLPEIPHLLVRVTEPLPSGAVVRCDGAVLGSASLGRKLPLDPGAHVLSVTLADGSTREQQVVLERGRTTEVELALPARSAPRADERHGRTKNGRALVYAASALGGAALGVGVVTGALAFAKKNIIAQHCEGTQCDRAGKRAADDAQRMARVSNIGFAVGITGLATALVVHLVNRRAQRSLASVSFEPEKLGVGVAF